MPPKPPPGQIRKAISEKRVVTFTYNNLSRTCEIHVLGVANGREQILCWQLSGGSRGGNPSPWRRFDTSGVADFQLTEETFSGSRPVPYPHSQWDEVIMSV